ncbi:uncharacterized protein [Leptinotarsa decemlineata]|uniref:uncharacterized protein n=1 Tax=Leptinotarsa decemlineata TaxID=7539 RepID=UPI003D3097E8
MMRRRSRSPLGAESSYRRERSFSMSSVSSCSFENERKTYFSRKNSACNEKSHTGYENKHRERRHNRREKNIGGLSKDRHRHKEQDESNKSHLTGLHKPNINSMEESLDPSICQFRGSSSGKQDETEEDDRNISASRLDRLEKMMEAIVQNKSQVNVKPPMEQSDPTFSGELIPRNTNFTTSMWLNRISEECLERNFDEKTCIKFIESKMTGIIKSWYKTLESYDYTWPELKMLITKLFPDNTEFAATLRLLVNRVKKPEETITQYYFCKMYLIEACKISGVNAVSCLIDGLVNPLLQQEAKAGSFLTPESLYSQYFCNLQNYEVVEHHLVEDDHEMVSRPIHREITLVDNYPEIDEFQSNTRPPPVADMYASKQCYTCGRYGHIAEICRHAPLCYNCGLKGHIAAKCMKKK